MAKPKWTMPDGDDSLSEPSAADFEHIPHIGWRFIGDGRSVILAQLSITKPDMQFSDTELFQHGAAIQTFFDNIKGVPEQSYIDGGVLQKGDFPRYSGEYGYKFVTQETYDQFVSNGSFLLSSLTRFRDFEDQGDPAGDRFEGSAHSAYSVADRQLTVSTLSGFDTHIFSLASDLENAAEMKSKFGGLVLRIRIQPFAKLLARAVHASPAEIRPVRYADLKLYRSELSLAEVADFPPNLTSRLAKALRWRGRLPSIFAKPSRFESEREVRIAITMPSDVEYQTAIQDGRLLDHVELVDI